MSTIVKTESPAERRLGEAADEHRSPVFVTRRRRWPGVLAAGVIGAGIAAAAVSSLYDERSVGTRIDAGVDAAKSSVDARVEAVRDAASEAGRGAAQAGERMAAALGDAGITAAVKTALAADPTLSALRIAVSTHAGVVRLEGPAPDARARDRAQVLAAAPAGVVSVENRLVLPPERLEGGGLRVN
jgi:hypothetical protein